jgi:lipopolysaccharide transport system permease protein
LDVFTPIIYPSSLIPNNWRWLFIFNPLTGIIEGYRSAIFGRSFDFTSLGISILITVVILIYSVYRFRHWSAVSPILFKIKLTTAVEHAE